MKKKNVLFLMGNIDYSCYQGMIAYAKKAGWQIDNQSFYTGGVPSDKGFDGIISIHGQKPEILEVLASTKLPVVDAGGDAGLDIYRVTFNNRLIGERIAQHFTYSGFSNYAFFLTNRHREFDQARAEGFKIRVQKNHKDFKLLSCSKDNDQAKFLETDLPKLNFPVAIMTSNDLDSKIIVEAASLVGIQIPKELAVIGVKMDDDICELSQIPLSNISNNAFEVGYTAAQNLDRLMLGKEVLQRVELVDPGQIEVRQSSDVLAVKHKEVLKAIHYIAQNFCHFINVNDVLKRSKITSAALHRAFKKSIGHSILEEITRQRIEKAIVLLEKSSMKVKDISEACGFSSSMRMGQVFKRVKGKSPLKFRPIV